MDQAVQAVLLDNRRLEFDAERRAFHKLELKKVHQQQATDIPEPELMGNLEPRVATLQLFHAFLFITSLLAQRISILPSISSVVPARISTLYVNMRKPCVCLQSDV